MKYLETKKKPGFFKFLRSIIAFFYGKKRFEGIENMPETPSIYVGNHAQLHGPLMSELYFPKKKLIWCIGNMMSRKELPSYAFEDFWSMKPKWTHWFYKFLAHLIAPIASYCFSHADCIGVYKDARIMNTFKETINALNENINVVIFPEGRIKYNEIVNEFQDKFIDCARLYYSKYKKCVAFVPTYFCPKLKKAIFGKPIVYDPNIEISEQRKIICDYLKKEITALAKELPVHTVVPYDNIPKKMYPKSK
jgi:1-acyl-sn-glycerol-3-phosphate acyltransferase